MQSCWTRLYSACFCLIRHDAAVGCADCSCVSCMYAQVSRTLACACCQSTIRKPQDNSYIRSNFVRTEAIFHHLCSSFLDSSRLCAIQVRHHSLCHLVCQALPDCQLCVAGSQLLYAAQYTVSDLLHTAGCLNSSTACSLTPAA